MTSQKMPIKYIKDEMFQIQFNDYSKYICEMLNINIVKHYLYLIRFFIATYELEPENGLSLC